jgi:hypothetical protein
MATDHKPEANANPGVGYEKQDLGHRGILVFFGFLLVATVIIHLVIWAMYTGLESYARSVEVAPHPMADNSPAAQTGVLMNTPMVNLDKFGVPRLQANDLSDMNTMRQQEEAYLHAGAWEKDGAIHLPIETAMQLVVQRGLPARASGVDPSKYNPAVVPTGAGFPGQHELTKASVELPESAQPEAKPAERQ